MRTTSLLTLVIGLAVALHAARVEAVLQINPVGDAYVRGGTSASTNYGASTMLEAKNPFSANYSRKSYLEFDTSPLDAAISYVLELAVVQGAGGTNAIGNALSWEFGVYGLPDGFEELAINWNNADGNDTGSGSGFVAPAQLLGTFSVLGQGVGDTVQFSSTALTNFIQSDADDILSLAIGRNTQEFSGNNYVHTFASRETTSTSPVLRAIPRPTSDVPEATSLATWFGMGLVVGGGFWLRRRRPGQTR